MAFLHFCFPEDQATPNNNNGLTTNRKRGKAFTAFDHSSHISLNHKELMKYFTSNSSRHSVETVATIDDISLSFSGNSSTSSCDSNTHRLESVQEETVNDRIVSWGADLMKGAKRQLNYWGEQRNALAEYKAGIVCQRNGQFHMAICRFEEALAIYRRACDVFDTETPCSDQQRRSPSWMKDLEFRKETSESALNLIEEALKMDGVGNKAELEGDYCSAKESYDQALDIVLNEVPSYTNKDSDPLVAYLKTKMGIICWKRGEYNEAGVTLLSVVEQGKKCGAHRLAYRTEYQTQGTRHIDHTNTCRRYYENALFTLGCVNLAKGKHSEALSEFTEVLEIQKCAYGSYHSSVAHTIVQMGTVYSCLGKFRGALKYYRTALGLQLTFAPDGDHVDIADVLNRMGIIYEKRGLYSRALVFYDNALDIYLNNLGRNHVDVATTLTYLGQSYRLSCMFDLSLEKYRMAQDIFENLVGRKHRNFAATLFGIGLIHQARGEYTKAMTKYDKALSIQKSVLGEIHLDIAVTMNSIGEIYAVKGKYSRSMNYFKKAINIRRKALGKTNMSVAQLLIDIAEFLVENDLVHEDANFLELACKLFRQARGICILQISRDTDLIENLTLAIYKLENGIFQFCETGATSIAQDGTYG